MKPAGVKLHIIRKILNTSRFVAVFCFLVFGAFACGREQANLSRGRQIKTGMTFREVYAILGEPDVGFGLPQKCTKEVSWLYYEIPNDRYIVVNFIGDLVDDPPTSIEDRSALVW
jgi:hypothetical protein